MSPEEKIEAAKDLFNKIVVERDGFLMGQRSEPDKFPNIYVVLLTLFVGLEPEDIHDAETIKISLRYCINYGNDFDWFIGNVKRYKSIKV
jgi:hypothetical protein